MKKAAFKRVNKSTMVGGQGDLMPCAKAFHRLGCKAAKKALKIEVRQLIGEYYNA